MIELKYQGVQIGKIPTAELFTRTKALLLKIYVITGWVIPTGDMQKVLIGQMVPKLHESYSMLNFEEIEYAFRKAGTTVIDYGKDMNLALIDQVLIPYVNDRLKASGIEEQIKTTAPAQRIYTDQEILNQRRGDIEAAYQSIRRGGRPIIFDYFIDVLILDGFIGPDDTAVDFFLLSAKQNIERLYSYEK